MTFLGTTGGIAALNHRLMAFKPPAWDKHQAAALRLQPRWLADIQSRRWLQSLRGGHQPLIDFREQHE